LFDGFEITRVKVGEFEHNLRIGGSGPPVLLLHGYPQTHVCWHKVAPLLAETFTVVCPDLRGYGDSSKPTGDAGHRGYAKRTLAMDQIRLMQLLGYEHFSVVGHNRGARVARRLALDHPASVSNVALLDVVPTAFIYNNLDQRRATQVWRYFFLIQPADFPERMIEASREAYLRATLESWCGSPGAIAHEAVSEYERCFDTATIHASCEDYRAGAGPDLEDDSIRETIGCPVLLMFSAPQLGALCDVPAAWRSEVSGQLQFSSLDCGHFLAEERPEQVALELQRFPLGQTI
jgi:haloacetate dehalogenase